MEYLTRTDRCVTISKRAEFLSAVNDVQMIMFDKENKDILFACDHNECAYVIKKLEDVQGGREKQLSSRTVTLPPFLSISLTLSIYYLIVPLAL